MQISTKLTLVLGLVSSCILGTYGLSQYRQERGELITTAARDFRTLSAAIRVAIENSMRDRQVADVDEILESLEVGEPQIDVFVLDRTGALAAHSSGGGRAAVEHFERALRRVSERGHEAVRFEEPGDALRIVGVFPLHGDDQSRIGAVAIVRPLPALNADLRRTLRSALVSSVVLIAAITFVGWLLMRRYVRRPLEALGAAMRDVREGDFGTALPAGRHDEIGRLSGEFNVMVRELAHARQALLAAVEERQRFEQGLQHVDKLVTVGQLSAGLAHEIGSPLQILSGRARALAARRDLPPDVARVARICEEQVGRIAGIVEQLLDLARRKSPHIAEIALDTPIGAIVDLLDGEARRRGVHLAYTCPADLPPVLADAAQVQQIALNLLNNALRATPRGGRVTLTLSLESLPTADGLHDRPTVLLVVEDTGPGIPASVRERLFEPFVTTQAAAGGTGLGLAVVKSIVDDHGGAIAVAPAPWGGTRVLVHLPAAGPLQRRGVVA